MLGVTDFQNESVDAGEVGAGQTVTAMYEVELKANLPDLRYVTASPTETSPQATVSEEIGFVKIRFKEPADSSSQLLTTPIERKDAKTSVGSSTPDFKFAAAVCAFAERLRQNRNAPTASFLDIAKLASDGKGTDKGGQRQEFIRLVQDTSVFETRFSRPGLRYSKGLHR